MPDGLLTHHPARCKGSGSNDGQVYDWEWLVLNVLVLWNTRYVQVALNELQRQGVQVKAEDVARLSPLKHKHIYMLGRYQFTLADSLRRGALSPLRDPNDPDEQML
jgi:hypothetical protein